MDAAIGAVNGDADDGRRCRKHSNYYGRGHRLAHVVFAGAVVVIDETRAKHGGGGESEGCVVMVLLEWDIMMSKEEKRSFSKRTDRCSVVLGVKKAIVFLRLEV